MRTVRLVSLAAASSARMGLTLDACLMMAKAAIPSTIAIAAMQSTTWATHFGPLNYLIAIEALLAHCILPRVPFLQTLLLNVLLACVAAAMNLFALWCAIKARSGSTSGYDSSASAVLAVWFMLQVYLVNALRSSRPQFSLPCINYCIYTMIMIAQFGPTCGTIEEAEASTSLLLQAHLTGFAIAAGVSICVLPRSNRAIAIATTQKYIASLRGVLSESQKVSTDGKGQAHLETEEALRSFSGAFTKVRALDTKLKGDLEFAVRDLGYGHLTGDDLENFYRHLHGIYLFMSGLRDVIEDVVTLRAMPTCERFEGYSRPAALDYAYVLNGEACGYLIAETTSALNDVESWLLERPNHSPKIESVFAMEKDDTSPRLLVARIVNIDRLARELMKPTTTQKALSAEHPEWQHRCNACCQYLQKAVLIDQRTRFVLWHLSKAVLLVLEFADTMISKTRSKHKQMIVPSGSVLYEWLVHMFKSPDAASHTYSSDVLDGHTSLNPNNLYRQDRRWPHDGSRIQAIRLRIRKASRLLRSPHSLFGFRAMCASMSIGIVAYLKDSHEFFVRQRMIWAIVMTMIAMKTTSGQTTFEFLLRLFASVAGTIGSIVIWYIVDSHQAGVIVFLFLYMMVSFYFGVVKPRYTLLALVSAVTPIIGVGYVLNVQKLGAAYLGEFDTPAYPIYQVAGYRLVNVVAGLFVAYIWTFVPYPLTEHSVIRQSMGACIFLLAQYNAIVSKTLLTSDRLEFDEETTANLRQIRLETLQQTQKHLAKLKTLSAYVKWVFSIGEELRLEELKEVIDILDQMITHSTSLGIASSLLTYAAASKDKHTDSHVTSLNKMATSIDLSVSALCLMSASITNDLPLPPYLFLTEALDAVAFPIFTPTQTADTSSNEYDMDTNAIAVISAATRKIQADVRQLTQVVKTLCGELDFSASTLRSKLEPQVSYDA